MSLSYYPQGTPRPVLLVDDSDDDMCLLRRILMTAGTTNPLMSVEDGLDAREYLRASISPPNPELLPCIVFTDLRMPRMNGIELITWARSQSHLDPVRFIVLSTSQDERDRKACRTAGADEYLMKFPAPEVFRDLISLANTRPRLPAHPKTAS